MVEHSLDPVHELEYAERSGKDDPPTNEVQEVNEGFTCGSYYSAKIVLLEQLCQLTNNI